MSSTTSGLTQFTLDVDEIIEEALEPLEGIDHTSGVEQQKARRALNLILIELQNKNIPLNKLETVTTALTSGTDTYTFSGDVIDVLEMTINTPSNQDTFTALNRLGRIDFHLIPDKTQEGRPTSYTTDRNSNLTSFTVWPVPNEDNYSTKSIVSKRVEDVTASYQKIDISYRYYPLIIKWLAYDTAFKKEGYPLDKLALLKNRLNEIMVDTFEEDRERADFVIIPGGISSR